MSYSFFMNFFTPTIGLLCLAELTNTIIFLQVSKIKDRCSKNAKEAKTTNCITQHVL